VREAAARGLSDAGLGWRDIGGVMMPDLYLADALGATDKPIMRAHTAGSVGGGTAIVASLTEGDGPEHPLPAL
jgi:acetyl-CoA C-acetyltransferase